MMKRFENRLMAGALLARRLAKYRSNNEAVVLALPRGGVPVAFAVAKKLHLPLDVLPVRKLGVPGHEEFAMGAIADGGVCVTMDDVTHMLQLDAASIDAVANRELQEIERQTNLYRANQPPLQLQGRTVILVDDGLATGATMQVAVKTARKQLASRIVVAIPVGAQDSCSTMQQQADEVVCPLMPQDFRAVSLYYENFSQVSDQEVLDLLEQSRHWLPSADSVQPNVPATFSGQSSPSGKH